MRKILFVLLMFILSFGASAKQSRLLEWEDLVPLDLRARALEIQEKIYNYNPHDDNPEAMTQIKMDDVVEELDGEYVKITGFIVPLEFDIEYVNEFLLAPYMGACIHVPPPPANQIILVKSEKESKDRRYLLSLYVRRHIIHPKFRYYVGTNRLYVRGQRL